MFLTCLKNTISHFLIFSIVFLVSCSPQKVSTDEIVSSYIDAMKKRDIVSLRKLDLYYCQSLLFIKNAKEPEPIANKKILDLENEFDREMLRSFYGFDFNKLKYVEEFSGSPNYFIMYPSYDYKVIKTNKSKYPLTGVEYYEVWVELNYSNSKNAPKSSKGTIKKIFVKFDITQYPDVNPLSEIYKSKFERPAVKSLEIVEEGRTYF